MGSQTREYQDGMLAAWQGELWGKAFFDLLAEAAEDAEHRAKWQTLAELEQVTGDRLAPLVVDDAESPSESRPSPDAAATVYARLSHVDAMRQMMTILDPAIARFQRLLAIAPDADRETVQLLVDHEIALKEFAERELAGDAGDSLAPVRAVIDRTRSTA